MAHKKGAGSSDNGRDSNSKRLGIKLFGGQTAKAGNIILRQRGTRFHVGEHVLIGRDHTLHAAVDGVIAFRKKRDNRTYVSVIPTHPVDETLAGAKKKKKKAAPKAAPAPEVEAVVEAAPVVEETPAPVEAAAPAPVVEEAPEEAKTLEGEEAEAAKADLISSIGTASADDKDDLKKIKGVGPKLEGVLNSMGIFKFEQVSKMTDKEYAIVDSLLSSFKGRAKRDDWAGQASGLM